jgi:membrane protein YqaA with SNARE-associated domain
MPHRGFGKIALLLKTLADALIAFGPFGVLLIGFFDSLGVPLPAALDALLITIAIKAPQQAYYAAVLAVIGSMAGNYILFHAARYGSRWVKAETPDSKRERFRLWFARYGLLTVFVPAVVPFVPLPLKVFVISAGAMRTHTSRFLGVMFVARVIRYFGQAWLATRLGQDARGFLTHNAWNMAAVVFTMALALVALIKWYDRRRAEA